MLRPVDFESKPMNKHIKLYWQYRWMKARASHDVRRNGELLAARTLWALNHVAKERGGYVADQIYALKAVAIKYWYLEGRVLAVGQQRQELTCKRCGGTGDDPYRDGECVRCFGTGIWKSHNLYTFKLDLGGEVFEWHQPASMVDYDVELTEGDVGQYARRSSSPPVGYDSEYGYCVVLEYLRQQGVPNLPELLTARKVAKRIWKESRPRHWLFKAHRWVQARLPKRQFEVDEIPF